MLSLKFLTSLAAFIHSSASNGDYSFCRSFIKSKFNKYLVMIIGSLSNYDDHNDDFKKQQV